MQRPAMTPALRGAAWLVATLAFASILLSALPEGNASCNHPDLFPCNNGKCINHTSLCNGNQDCEDGSDEEDCDDVRIEESDRCDENDFRCEDDFCIPAHWKCDGHVDCLDGTDETIGCTKQVRTCPEGQVLQKDNRTCSLPKHCSRHEFQCEKENKCIPLLKRCDGHSDCEGDEDENKCPCLPNQFECTNGQCISHLQHCDDQMQCSDGSDEFNCHTEICLDDQFQCSSGECINSTWKCDNHEDCHDGSDESDCTEGHQVCFGFGCSHTCVPSPEGPICICPKGFAISNVKHCADIDECQQYGICSQRCKNTPGSYRCGCATGFSLQSDNKTCKAESPDPLLVFPMKTEVRAFELRSQIYFRVVKEQKHIIGVAFDGTHMYWTTTVDGEEAIVRSDKDGSNRKILVTTGLHLLEDLAIDWLTGNIYFTDSEMDHIGVCENSGKICTVLDNEDIDSPRAIVLHVIEGVVFWTDWGHKPMIGRSGMDGSFSAPFVTDKIQWPGGLAMDIYNERLYWVDTKLDLVDSIKLDGTDRRSILTDVLKHPYALAVFEDNLYWSDFENNEIQSCNKFTGKNIQKVVYSRNHYLPRLQIYHPSMQPEGTKNPCRDAPCSDMCLLAPNTTYSCACPKNKLLKEDKHSCQDIENLEGLAIRGGNKLIQLVYNTFGKQEMTERAFEHIEKMGAQAYNIHGAACHPPDLFRCYNGKCISNTFVCDGKEDCGDGSDEKDCNDVRIEESDPCNENDFRCGDDVCIPAHWKCDGNMDCLDGTDETIGCSKQVRKQESYS